MDDSKKLGLATFGTSYIFAGCRVFILLVVAVVCAGSQVTKVQQYVRASQKKIQKFEQAGDFSTALKIARNSKKKTLKLGLTSETAYFSESVKRLEEELLGLGSSRLLFDEKFQPRVKLLKLLELVGMEPLNPSEKAILQINRWAQQNLLRQGERWQEQTSQFEELKPKIKPLLKALGFIDSSSAHFEKYQGAIVPGALLSRVRLRLHYLIEQWKQGARFSDLYFLGGERPLERDHEYEGLFIQEKDSPLKIRKEWVVPNEIPQTECEMMHLVWDQSEIPEEMRKEVHVHFINSPMKSTPGSTKLQRPTTDDIILDWLKGAPPYGSYLVTVNAPFTHRHDLVLRMLVPRGYGFDTIGSKASEQEKVAIFLDELARCIFQTKRLSEK